MSSKIALYSGVGEELTHYEVDAGCAALLKRGSVRLPANVQYSWPHPSQPFLYVASSNRGADEKADFNHLSALRIDPASGALTPHGEPRPMRYRAVHMTLDASGGYAVIAHNEPPAVSAFRIASDGTVGAEVVQPQGLDYGIYPHQAMITPSNQNVILIARGNSAKGTKPEDPGALKVFRFKDGLLANRTSIAPGGGYGFGPRHLDFHRSQPWMYVSLERQSKLSFFRMHDDQPAAEAASTLDLLADRAGVTPRQLSGAIRVHPDGRFVYVINRADLTVDFNGKPVFGGGENSIVVYAIDQHSGEPTFVQRIDTHLFHVRTFSIDPSARMLVAASIKPMMVREGGEVSTVPAGMSVFRIGGDGRLEYVRKYDVETGGKLQFWMGMVGLQ